MEQKLQRRKVRSQKEGGHKYDLAFKRKIAMLHRESGDTVQMIARQYGIRHQDVSRWGRQFSSELAEEPIILSMTEQEQKDMNALVKQMEALKKKLEFEQMRTFALETMLDLAKTELGIDVRKNFGAKQPKK
jgi:transposase-like protein